METLDFQDPVEGFRRQIFDLNTMLEIGKTLNASLSLRDVLDIIILTCSGHFHASDAILLLSSEEGGGRIIFPTLRKMIKLHSDQPIHSFTI